MSAVSGNNPIPSKIMTGARAVVYLSTGASGPTPIAVFNTIAYSSRQEKIPAYVLGHYGPVEFTPTAQDPITVQLSGFRVVDKGPFAIGQATLVNDLIREGDFQITVVDRQTDKELLKVGGCRVVSFSGGFSQRAQSDLRIEIVGMTINDESTNNSNSETGGPLW